MPIYRVNGMLVHLKISGTKKRPAPAPCAGQISLEGRKTRCMAVSTALCDYRHEDGTTCDAPLCAEHAHAIGPDTHLCPIHYPMYLASDEYQRDR